jgi:hypothetical protein
MDMARTRRCRSAQMTSSWPAGAKRIGCSFYNLRPFGETGDGRPFGADLPLAAPGVAKRGQGWPKATAGGGASAASGLEGASGPVSSGQVRAEGPLGRWKSARRAGLIPGGAGAATGKGYRYLTKGMCHKTHVRKPAETRRRSSQNAREWRHKRHVEKSR